uniref:NADH-ubiquinone oxidoreductase chain 2 n=1 Tax=Physunio superbus TaxID=2494254 RepID=A0A8A3WMT4_9BIVA|nr:NADH dehydrogenase subunit 2 [Physunio superbus]
MKPIPLNFVLLLLLSTMISLTTSNSFLIWAMLELNMLSFIPIIHITDSNTEAETSVKYIIPQAFGSSLLMTSIILMTATQHSNFLGTLALTMKLGSAPFHSWFPPIMASANLFASFILATWQKLAPLLLLTSEQFAYSPLITTLSISSAIWGSVAGLNQTNLLKLLAFSSINHLGWLMMASLLNSLTQTLYLMFYSLSLLPAFLVMKTSNTKTYMITTVELSTNVKMPILTVSLLSLSGLPPMSMFMMKLPIIMMMASKSMSIQLLLMLMSATISLYFYLSLMMPLWLNHSLKTRNPKYHSPLPLTKPIYIFLITTQLMALPTWLTFLP